MRAELSPHGDSKGLQVLPCGEGEVVEEEGSLQETADVYDDGMVRW